MTDDYIEELIQCEKRIVKPPAPLAEVNRHWQSSFVVRRVGSDETFYVFLRQLVKLQENYSVGLSLTAPARCALLRYNGSHAKHKNPDGSLLPAAPHIHKLEESRMKAGKKAMAYAETTAKYHTFEEAQIALFTDTGIQAWEKYFTHLLPLKSVLQIPLFDVSSDHES